MIFEEMNQCEGPNQYTISRTTAIGKTKLGKNKSRVKLLALNPDCFEHLSDWLTLHELLTLRVVCKRIKLIIDNFIYLKHPNLRHSCLGEHRPHHHSEWPTYLRWCKHLRISTFRWNGGNNENIIHILHQIETLTFNYVRIDGDLYEVLLKHCPQLKHLALKCLKVPDVIAGSECQWLQRFYPTLEHLEIEIYANAKSRQCPKLFTFLERNPNIRALTASSRFLLMNRQSILHSNIKLDRLYVKMDQRSYDTYNLLRHLFQRGFYKQLHLNSHYCNEYLRGLIDYSSRIGDLEMLHVHTLPAEIPMSKLASLKELKVWGPPLNFCKLAAKHLINLRRVHIWNAHFNDIFQFVIHAPQLEEIKYEYAYGLNYIQRQDLCDLNETRRELPSARKVTIFIPEKEFLILKWMAGVDFSFIKFKRLESCAKHRFEKYW